MKHGLEKKEKGEETLWRVGKPRKETVNNCNGKKTSPLPSALLLSPANNSHEGKCTRKHYHRNYL